MRWRSKVRYPVDYVSYWNAKGEYGKERVRRMLDRKHKRVKKHIENRKNNAKRYGGYWLGEDGRRWQYCEWPEGGICEYPCNGDC